MNFVIVVMIFEDEYIHGSIKQYDFNARLLPVLSECIQCNWKKAKRCQIGPYVDLYVWMIRSLVIVVAFFQFP